MIQEKIKDLIRSALTHLDIHADEVNLEHPVDLKMGDYSTNIAMALAKGLETNPKSLAEKIVTQISKNLPSEISKVEVAGPGFINLFLSREFFSQSIKEILEKSTKWGANDFAAGKKYMVEYTDPNPFKPFHIGHLMTNAIGESIARILEHSGADVSRANYQGDVGLHVARAIYGMHEMGMPKDINAPVSELAQYIGAAYAKGSSAYEEDAEGNSAKKWIDDVNKKIYDRSDAEVNQVYDWGFKVTMEAFEEIYKMLGTKFVYYFLESHMAPVGIKIVNENLVGDFPGSKQVFEESDGAIVFKAEKYDPKLHTRVFITSKGLPAYETKELGLCQEKFKVLPDMAQSVVITANEQQEYMKVVAKAISLIHPEYESRMKHITHGMMRFATGKMGSRKGNVITGESLLRDAKALVLEKMKEREFTESENNAISEKVSVAALKYSILRQSIGGDIMYDFEKSISFEGDSGPYLQYSAIRSQSILRKTDKQANDYFNFENVPSEVSDLEKYLYRFPEVVIHSYHELQPHHVATYLTELASLFNSFYAHTKIINEETTSLYYLALTKSFLITMENGLNVLGISLPEKM